MSDSGLRLRSVRLKPGVMADGLYSALSGLGTTSDPTTANRYWFAPLTQYEIEAAYRGSGMMRKAIRIRVLDKVRAGRDWQAEADQITAIEKEEKRLGLKQALYQAELFRALGGGAIILGVPGEPSQPVPATIGKGKLAFLQVLNRWQLQGRDWITDPTQEGYGGPAMWSVTTTTGLVDIHPSRVVAFRGEPLPNLIGSADEDVFWGESRIEHMLGAVQNSDTAQQAFSALITKARSTIVGIPELSDHLATAEGKTLLRTRISEMVRLESMFNAIIRDAGDGTPGAGETIEHRQVVWNGIRDVMFALASFVAAMADVPVTRLLGTAAEGMNASGDSQQRDYRKSIEADQELTLEPCLERIDAALIPSALGNRPPEIWWQFAPIDAPTEKEVAEIFKLMMEGVEKLQNTGAIPDRAFAEGFQGLVIERGWLPGIEGPLADLEEDERYGIIEEREDLEQARLEAANENTVAEMQQRGAINGDQAAALLSDAAPRTLYVRRDVVNVADLKAWAKEQGLPELQDGLHVTIIYSTEAVDWMKVGSEWSDDDKGQITIPPGGARIVERLDDRTAVLLFASSRLS